MDIDNNQLLSLDELRDLWNAQVDAANSWDALGADEIVWWAQRQALARAGLAQQLNGTDPIRGVPPLLAARDALAEPAPPAAGEVGEGVTDEAAVEAAAELIYAEAMEWAARTPIPHGHCNIPAWQHGGNSDAQDVARRVARAVLARWGNHFPDATKMVGPAAGDAAELVAWLRGANWDSKRQTLATRVADLLEQLSSGWVVPTVEQFAPVPVPVSERLPRQEDCDAGGRCWGLHPYNPEDDNVWNYWSLIPASLLPFTRTWIGCTHWLPATALPLPTDAAQPPA